MKTRNSLVSNSSSTSFIVTESEKEQAIQYGLKLIPVSVLQNVKKEITNMGGDFLFTHYLWGNIDAIDSSSYITEPFDRDCAHEKDIWYPAFESDL